MTDRVIALIDMDCFYCQVETRLNPSLIGHPLAVVQYNQWKGGGIIAVNYEARDKGVTRMMRGEDAKKQCPEIILVSVPTIRDKADLTRYRDAGREVLSVFCKFTDCVQRASVDEAFIDLTALVNERIESMSQFDPNLWKSTFVVGYSTNGSNDEEERASGLKSWLQDCESIHNSPSLRLAVGGLIVEEMRAAVLAETSFKCSAGIAHNKILAKLACGFHKPNRQTVLPQESVEELFKTLSVKKIRNLGGKLGDDIVEKLGCKFMGDLLKFSERDLQTRYDEKNGSWLYNIVRGYDFEPVTPRLISKSIGCCKKFPGKQALIKSQDVYHWLNELADELSDRLLEDEAINKRRANLLTVSMAIEINKVDNACSKSVNIISYNKDKIVSQAEALLKKVCKVDSSSGLWSPPIKFLGFSAGKFSDVVAHKLENFFKVAVRPGQKKTPEQVGNGVVEESQKNETVNEPSFFEKALAQEIHSSGKKLHIVPDLTKNDLFIDSDDSQSSLVKKISENRECEHESNGSRDSVKKKLFSFESVYFQRISSSNESVRNNNQQKQDPNDLSINANEQKKDQNDVLEDFNEQKKEYNCLSKNANDQNKDKNGLLKNVNEQKKDQNGLSKKAKIKTGNSSKSSITSFFGNTEKNNSWTSVEELFPDLSQIDDEMIALLPKSYQEKIIKLKKENSVKEGPSVQDNFNLLKVNELKNLNSKQNSFQKIGSDCTNIAELPSNVSSFSCGNKDMTNFYIEDIVSDDHLVKCDECGEKVSDYDMHMDMHFAKKLHKELNSNSQTLNVVIKEKVVKTKDKRKKSVTKTESTSNVKKLKSIDTFFKR